MAWRHMCVCPYMAAEIMQQHAEEYESTSSRPDMSEARHLCSRVSATCKSSPVWNNYCQKLCVQGCSTLNLAVAVMLLPLAVWGSIEPVCQI